MSGIGEEKMSVLDSLSPCSAKALSHHIRHAIAQHLAFQLDLASAQELLGHLPIAGMSLQPAVVTPWDRQHLHWNRNLALKQPSKTVVGLKIISLSSSNS